MSSAPILELRHLGKSFAGVQALDDVSISVGRGEIHCLAGENGSGKSTLIKIISGVHQPDRGEMLIDGSTIGALTPALAISYGVQVIYQDFSLFGNLSVGENLALGNELGKRRRLVNWRQVRRTASEAIARLGVDIDLDARIETLSVAGKQLVAIARALVSDARLLVMDEPTTALTTREVENLFQIVRELRNGGISILFVSHKMREMLEISERLTVIRNGRNVAAGAINDFDEESIARAMTGSDVAGARYKWQAPSAPPRLEIDKLFVEGELFDLSFTCGSGEIVGLAGLLGSGRTELALTLFGMRPTYRGTIRSDGKEIFVRGIPAAMAAGIAYVPEDRLSEGLFLQQSVDHNILVSSYGALAPHGFVNFGRAAFVAARTREEMQINTQTGSRPVRELSGGNQQRVVIGRWLLTEARLLILNGPTAGVDVGSKAGIHHKIRELATSRGLTVLIISDDLSELIQNCNRLMIMHGGRIIDTLDTLDLDEKLLGDRLRNLT